MRFDRGNDSSNVEDRRGRGGGGRLGGRGIKLGLGGTVVVLALSVLTQRNLFTELGIDTGGSASLPESSGPDPQRQAAEEELRNVAVGAFNDAQDVFTQVFAANNDTYRPAKLVLFWDGVDSGCGSAGSEVGPFYCPPDGKVYIDLGFFRELSTRFGAPGDFAQAYVIAHEVGHHMQNILGVEKKMRGQQRADPSRENELSVRLELQADCFAGVWASTAAQRKLLDPGDVKEALGAASAVGDDTIQKKAQGRVVPDSFTHGSAAQRMRWFQKGFEGGKLDSCDTFAADSL